MWKEFIPELEAYIKDQGDFDYFLVAGYAYLIHSKLIKMFKNKAFVIHLSLVPMYKGSTPIQSVLLNGEKDTGISILEISPKKFDAGKVILQEVVPIAPDDTYGSLKDKLKHTARCLTTYFFDNKKRKLKTNELDLTSE